ncbi:MAG: MltA domain-containing protein [Saprospiraceae bacterium]|nr:MltA domain-containing protein [Saprospiraceae bacterium]
MPLEKQYLRYCLPGFLAAILLFQASCETVLPSEAAADSEIDRIVVDTSVRKAPPPPPRKVKNSVLVLAQPDTLPLVPFNAGMYVALEHQYEYLKRPDVPRVPVAGITKKEMQQTLLLLQSIQFLPPFLLPEHFDFYRVNTDLKSDRVRVTGYYTPVVKASRTRSGPYQYPLLRKPSGDPSLPSTSAIEAGALDNSGLALAWLSSRKAVRNAQLQGSCMVEFPDGSRDYLGFGGSAPGADGSYVFFQKIDETQVLGAGFFPLTPGYSIAVDTRYIPLGATLLAELPDLDRAGHLKGYTYRYVFAQDRGGAILTTKRIDLYCGVGDKALDDARRINQYGRLWLILPKR